MNQIQDLFTANILKLEGCHPISNVIPKLRGKIRLQFLLGLARFKSDILFYSIYYRWK